MKHRFKHRKFGLSVRATLLLGLALLLWPSARAARAAAPDSAFAVVKIASDQPVAIGSMSEDTLIHTNRQYAFRAIPQELLGLEYTAHEHRSPATLTCRVAREGRLYLLLWGKATPQSLGLGKGWRLSVKTVEGGGGDGAGSWRLYQTKVVKDESLIILAANRWGSVVVAKSIKLDKRREIGKAPPNKAAPNARQKPPSPQRQKLLEQQSLRREALSWPSDRDELDAVLRRTAALLADLIGNHADLDHDQSLPTAGPLPHQGPDQPARPQPDLRVVRWIQLRQRLVHPQRRRHLAEHQRQRHHRATAGASAWSGGASDQRWLDLRRHRGRHLRLDRQRQDLVDRQRRAGHRVRRRPRHHAERLDE